MIYLVINLTNYGNGLYVAGYYKTWERAEKRLKWCQAHLHNSDATDNTEDDAMDSWQILPVVSPNITSVHGLPLKDGSIGNEAHL